MDSQYDSDIIREVKAQLAIDLNCSPVILIAKALFSAKLLDIREGDYFPENCDP